MHERKPFSLDTAKLLYAARDYAEATPEPDYEGASNFEDTLCELLDAALAAMTPVQRHVFMHTGFVKHMWEVASLVDDYRKKAASEQAGGLQQQDHEDQ
ncbi:hypothetical protein [Bradyrhizobium diazoefficiens]|uniref:hypothetical protein n=1 Tax=Bradyrhizobium diazoefficiens TaxID=1355477 RepID=UPI002714D690|nr:hypothetical protein [Bradyrhizobium diazoefficiens]WLC16678.1 hypothetical protein QIH76_42610 [Bradyrhizobium diazoefficiens]